MASQMLVHADGRNYATAKRKVIEAKYEGLLDSMYAA